jgi:hypothetical protein
MEMTQSEEPDGENTQPMALDNSEVLGVVNMVLTGWAPTLRAALLIGLVLAGVVAIAVFSPWASTLPALAAVGWLGRRRGKTDVSRSE